jgi:hypothetical protein
VARFAVEIGWAIDGDAANVTHALGEGPGQGSWGIVRLDGTSPQAAAVLAALFDPRTGYVPTHGFRVGTVEDAVCWKYGRHSWELVSQITGHRVGEN